MIVIVMLEAFVVASGGSVTNAAELITLPVISDVTKGVGIRDWLVIGPFTSEGADNSDPWKTDFFATAGASEALFDAGSYRQYARTLKNSGELNNSSQSWWATNLSKSDFVDFFNLYGLPRDNSLPPCAAYAACEIHSEVQSDAYLLVGSSDGGKIWLNGEMLLNAANTRGVYTFSDCVRLRLRAGSNFLLLKIPRKGVNWGLTARIEPSRDAASATALRARETEQGLLLEKSVLSRGEPLKIVPRGSPVDALFQVEILREDGTLLERTTLGNSSGSWLSKDSGIQGLFTARLRVLDVSCDEQFIVGDPEELGLALLKRAERFENDKRVKINVDTLRRRWMTLCLPENRQFKSAGLRRDWERKLVFTISEIRDVVDHLEQSKDPFKDVVGLHLRAFVSRIDEQPQHYRLFVPRSYARGAGRLPLIAILPTVTSAARPFIDSAFVAAHNEAERIDMIAERYNVAVVWSGYRNQPLGLPCEAAHLDEVLAAISKDYDIDHDRVSLMSSCSGGANAFLIASQRRTEFAAIGVLNTLGGLTRSVSPEAFGYFYKIPEFRSWGRENNAANKLFSDHGPAIYAIHDGAEPGHGDLKASIALNEMASSQKYPLRFEQRAQTLAQHFGAWDAIMNWLVTQKRSSDRSARDMSVQGGPIVEARVADVLANRFLVVEGTIGDEETRREIARISKSFQDSWKAFYFNPCRVVTDKDFDEESEKDSNLLLIGNAETNILWQRMVEKIPLQITFQGVAVKARTWSAPDLSVEVVLPNPKNPSRKIIFLGGNNLPRVRFPALGVGGDGWFSFSIWQNKEGHTSLVEAGVWP